MGRVIALVVVFAAALGVGVYMTFSSGASTELRVDPNVARADLKKTKELLASGEISEALELIGHHVEQTDHELLDREWIRMAIRAYGEMGDPLNLAGLYNMYPEEFRSEEKASLVIARVSAFTKDLETYNDIVAVWKGRQGKPASWRFVEIDRLIQVGHMEEAERVVNEKTYSGTEEVERLIRKARIALRSDINEAWKILYEALEIDSEHPELYAWRGRVAEHGRRLQVAQREYLMALRLEPKNPVFRDQLGEFYRRHQQYKKAVFTWAGGLKKPSADAMWVKTLFWSRVAYPVQVKWNELEQPEGPNKKLVEFLMEMSEERFWDHEEFSQIVGSGEFIYKRQETFWLRLLEMLRGGEEERALQMLHENTFVNRSWHPDIELQLKRVLQYRLHDTFVYDTSSTVQGEQGKGLLEVRVQNNPMRHQFFRELDGFAKGEEVPEQTKYLLKSDDAFSALLLAGGWLEAAIQLRKARVYSEKYPSWLPFGIAQSLRQNRGDEEALAFAKQQPRTDPLELVIGEMQGSTGDLGGALETLQGIVHGKNGINMRAAWLSGLILISEKKYDEAREMINELPEFKEHLKGRELLARIALFEGDVDLANELYALLEDESAEAKSYLAHRAYQLKQWTRAKELTEDLLRINPTHPVLRENYLRIEAKIKEERETSR